MDKKKIPMKSEVKDIVTGFKGKVTAYLLYMTGCVQYQIEIANGTELKAYWVDEDRLEIIKEKKERKKYVSRYSRKGTGSGGPSRGPSSY